MHLSTLLTSLPLDFNLAALQAAKIGFSHIDVVAEIDRPPSHLEALAESGLRVACAALGRNLPDGIALDNPDVEARRIALSHLKQHVADAARLGATHGYVIPGTSATDEGLRGFTEACALLADHAAQRMVRLCVEHIPGRALPTVAATLRWLESVNHANLSLLLDVGHCAMTNEDPAAAIRAAGGKLGYMHFDDNDGVNDIHWPLLKGQLTPETLRAVIAALRDIGYDGALSLELNPSNPDPVQDLRDGKALLEELLASAI